LPSDLEGLSLALLDALGAGLCVLASDIPENVEVLDGAGFTFRRGDVRDLTTMLELLLANPVMRSVAGQMGREVVGQGYLWPRIVGQVGQLYQEVAGRDSRPQPLSTGLPVSDDLTRIKPAA